MDFLRIGVVKALNQNQQFHIARNHIFFGEAVKGAVFVDPMYNGPIQWEEVDGLQFEIQSLKPSLHGTIDFFKPSQGYPGTKVNQLITRSIYYPELQ